VVATELSGAPSYAQLEVLVVGQAALIGKQAARIAVLDTLVAELRARVDKNSRNSS
jgi:hypothetical protein